MLIITNDVVLGLLGFLALVELMLLPLCITKNIQRYVIVRIAR